VMWALTPAILDPGVPGFLEAVGTVAGTKR
jgi:hypothetical protein